MNKSLNLFFKKRRTSELLHLASFILLLVLIVIGLSFTYSIVTSIHSMPQTALIQEPSGDLYLLETKSKKR